VDSHGWHRRALPVTALAVGLVALLALVLPGVRHQLALSASHVPQEYVALSFARGSAGTVEACATSVRFSVHSELSETRTIAYVVSVGDTERTGSVVAEPGESVDVTQVVERPRGRFTVSVRLPDNDREILAHCGGKAP
jgi:hypothetical protein